MRFYAPIFIALFLIQPARAEIIFSPAVGYVQAKVEEAGTTFVDGSTVYVDARLGYLMSGGIYIGGIYAIESNEAASSYYAGGSLGFVAGGFSVIGSFIALGEYDPEGNDKYSGATGFQADISYSYMIASNFAIGPQLSYRSVEFSTYTVGSSESPTDRTDAQTLPMINIWFVF